MRYTVEDRPETVAKIQEDLSLIRETVRAGDPALRSLVLTGGFARGEGAMLDGKPQNDYDLIAIRGIGHGTRPYPEMRAELEQEIDLHIDLAPVGAWRIGRTSPSIFWYETAWRGRVLWGEDLLPRIPTRRTEDLDPREGLRLLANRAAGLLLATRNDDPHEHRIQAAKGLLAALDAHLFAAGLFPPSQTERWMLYQDLREAKRAPPALEPVHDALEWAYVFKVAPGRAPHADARHMWLTARRALLDAVPVALRRAGLGSLDDHARQDGLLDHAFYHWHARRLETVRTPLRNPTGRVRVATLRLLEAAHDGCVRKEALDHALADLTKHRPPTLADLESLRGATLQ